LFSEYLDQSEAGLQPTRDQSNQFEENAQEDKTDDLVPVKGWHQKGGVAEGPANSERENLYHHKDFSPSGRKLSLVTICSLTSQLVCIQKERCMLWTQKLPPRLQSPRKRPITKK